MAVQKTRYSSAEFIEFLNLPENADRFFERIDGEIIEHMPSFPYASGVGNLILYYIMGFVLENDLGNVTGEQGGYEVSEEDTFAPDVAFISHARQANLPNDKFNPVPPDLAVEVVSPSDLADPKRRIQRKLEKYKAARIPLLWYVYSDPQMVDVYRNGEFVETVGIDGVLDGYDVLPGFKLPVAKIFPKKR